MTRSTAPNELVAFLRSRASYGGILAGVCYGIMARYAAESQWTGDFVVMSLAFIVVVPLVLGVLTVTAVERPSIEYRIFAPWIPAILVIAVAMLVGWEGSICVYLGIIPILVFSSIGGVLGAIGAGRRASVRSAVLVLPLAAGSIERRTSAPVQITETVTSIRIAAPPAVVWPLVVSVDSIRPTEQRRALFTTLGFPRPISATISGSGVGAVRHARFEHGLVFTETVTDWVPQQRLAFTIRANTDSIPPNTLDRHVTIGGPFFDVLTGTYELHPIDDGRGTWLVLRSRHRTSTHFNAYADWWASRIMRSIQENILEVHRGRAEAIVGRLGSA